MTARPDNPEGLDGFDPMDDPAYAAGVQAYSDRLRDERGRPRIRLSDAPLHPSQDGPGAGEIVEVTVRVMVGSERSTVIVRRGRDPVLVHEVREHGREADGLGAAVEAAVRERLGRLS